VDEKAKQARLVVPVNLMVPGGFQLPPGGLPGQPRPGTLPFQAPPPSRDANAGRIGLPTIVAGLALTLAFASGGLWLVRRGRGRTAAGLLLVAAFALGATALWADIPGPGGGRARPPRPRPPEPVPANTTPLALPAGVELTGQVLLEVAPVGDAVRLIVPKDAVLKKGEDRGARE
jgi:hypothetical protein